MKLKFPLVLSLTIALSLTAPSAQAAVKKPSAPTITSVTSSAVKKGLVDVVVSISLPSNNGGSKILGSQVTGSGKSCTISATKTSCTLKGITKGASLSLKASSKNKIGFGKNSSAVKHKAGGAAYSAETRTPTFGTTTTTATGFIVQISNYDAAWTWAGTATASGTVAISATGLVTVSGVAINTSSTATITTTRSKYATGSASVTATSVYHPAFGTPTSTATGFTVQISNYDTAWTWAGTATASGTVAISASGLITVSGVATSTSSTATITTARTGYLGGSATSTATSLANLTPAFGTKTATVSGFTVQISNYDSAWSWAGTATASGTVVVSGSGLVTVSGVAASTSSTATITAARTNWTTGSATSTATSTS